MRSRRKNLFDLVGQIQFSPDFDCEALRETCHAAVNGKAAHNARLRGQSGTRAKTVVELRR